MEMQTIILDQPGEFRLTSTPQPQAPGPGEALVRVHRIGICGTDLHAFRGTQPFFSYPRILGHELGVEVLALDPAVSESAIAVGDRCSVEPYLNCGTCGACRRGRQNCCTRLQVLGVHIDGGMREYISVPIAKLHRSASLSYEQLALVETLAIGAHAAQRAQIEPGEWALVIGAGPIGLATMQFAGLAGARVIALDVNAERLAFCRARGLAEQTIDGRGDTLAALQELTDGELATAVFDATGNLASMARAFEYVAHAGRLTFVGLAQGDVGFHDPAFHRREITLLASRNALPADFSMIIGKIEAGAIDTQPWITHRAELAIMLETFPSWLRPETGVVKAILLMPDA
ncbi:MAG TPA: zinc-binding alcohol dehydrogenase family protein [Roseiflexaceae bacterium]|nr:zinc-binding alcohol dehydrogenase family protein [Roseiflexaceae bacterium]